MPHIFMLTNSQIQFTVYCLQFTYPMLVRSGMTLCQPQSIAYWTEGRRKPLHASFSIVSIPSSLTSALSSYNHNTCKI